MNPKIRLPQARLIGRDSVVQYMMSLPGPIIWVRAPQGSGKTSLGVEFAQQHAGPVIWLRLDEADCDPANFFNYLAQAVRGTEAVSDWSVPVLLSEHLVDLRGYTRLFIRSLAANCISTACFILDDVHTCQAAPFFRLFLEIFTEEVPASIRILMLSRSVPPVEVYRLQTSGLMQEVGAEVLTFTEEETTKLLALLGVERSGQSSEAVFTITMGWAAGIALAASWLNYQPQALLKHRPEAVLTDDGALSRTVASFLSEEVFATYSEEERHILFAVCWLPYFSSQWAVVLAGEPAADMIARLAARGALIYAYPGQRYTWHPLFQRFLWEKASLHVSAAQRAEWIECSLKLLCADDAVDEAITLALTQESAYAQAASMIAERAESMLMHAQHQTVARWIRTLPERYLSAWHYYWLGVATYSSDTEHAREAFLKAHEAFTLEKNEERGLLSLSWIIGSYFFHGAAKVPLREFLQKHVDPRRNDFAGLQDASTQAHLTLSILSSLLTIEPGHEDVALWEQRAWGVLRTAGVDPVLKARLLVHLAQHYFFSGRLSCIQALSALITTAPEAAQMPPLSARCFAYYVCLFDSVIEFDYVRLANTYIESRQCAEESGTHIMDGPFALIHAVGLLFQGRFSELYQRLKEEEARLSPHNHHLAGYLHIVQGWVANWNDEAIKAMEYARQTRSATRNLENKSLNVLAHILECTSLVLLNDPQCLVHIEALRVLGDTVNYPIAHIHADVLEAYVCIGQSRMEDAHLFLERGFAALSKEGQSGFLFLAIPKILRSVCAEALRCGIERPVRAMVREFKIWPIQFFCFGHFEARIHGTTLGSNEKSKGEQLIRLVASYAPKPVLLATVTQYIWGEASESTLHVTLSRLRKNLGPAFCIEHGKLSLSADFCWADTIELDNEVSQLEEALERGGVTETLVIERTQRILKLYRGDLLADQGEETRWLRLLREEWRRRITQLFGLMCKSLTPHGEVVVLEQLQRAIKIASPSETLVAALMNVCLHTRRYAEGIVACHHYFQAVPEAMVSSETKALAHRLGAFKTTPDEGALSL